MATVRDIVREALENAWEGGYSTFIIDNNSKTVAADLSQLVSGLENADLDEVECILKEWLAEKSKQVGEF